LLSLRDSIADALFPRNCIGCGNADTWLCDSCRRHIPLSTEQRCFVCRNTITPSGESCFSCRTSSSLDGLFVAAPYHSPLVSEMIHVFKYEFVDELATPLGLLLAEALRHSSVPLPDAIIPVPLHVWRQRYRGFNQAELLSRSIADRVAPGFPIPILGNTLIRRRFTLPQAKTRSAGERRENLSGAFGIAKDVPKGSLMKETVWLVDDVATTGATLEECADVLKRSGVKRIHGIVLGR
jgi:ComF family protein